MFDFSKYPYRNLFAEEIRSNLVYKDVHPKGYEEGRSESVSGGILYDFGEESIGFFSIQVKGKGKIRFDYGEWLGEIYDRHEEYMPHWFETPADEICVNSSTYVTVKADGRRAFRYVKVSAVEGDLEVSEPTLKTVQSRNPYDGSFRCSDPTLNAIFEISKRTTGLCMQDFLEDGIKRDGLCWISDARVHARCNYATYGNTCAVKNSLLYFLRSMRENGWIPTNGIIGGAHQHPANIKYMFDYVGGKTVEGTPNFYADCGEIYYAGYQADFLGMVYDYYRYSGDGEFIGKIWEFVKKAAEYTFTLVDELMSEGRFPKCSRRKVKWIDTLCDLGGLYCAALFAVKDYAKLCRIFGAPEDLDKANQAISTFTEKALDYMDGEKRMWRDCDTEATVYSPVAQSLAYVAGLCTEEELLAALKKMPKEFTAYPDAGMSKYWMLNGIFEAGHIEEGLAWMKKEWKPLLEYGYTTCIERWVAEDMEETSEDISLSACHAWSAGPADFLTRFVLGVQYLGGDQVKIKPNLCGLKFAVGSVPTPRGLIKVSVVNGKLEYTVPVGIQVVAG